MRAAARSGVRPAGIAAAMTLVTVFGLSLAAHGAFAGASIAASESGPGGVTLLFTLESYEISPSGDAGYSLIMAPGMAVSGQEGAPALPVKAAALAAPHGAVVSISLISEESEWLDGVIPQPWPSESIEGDEDLPHAVAELRPDDSYYGRGGTFPSAPVELREAGTLRGHRVISVLFWPFRFDADRGGVELRKRIAVRVNFDGGSEERPGPVRPGDLRWKPLLRGLLRNYDQGARWRHAPAPSRAMDEAGAIQQAPEFKILVRESSLYRVFYEDLAALGFPPGVEVSELRLFERVYSTPIQESVETEVSILVDDLDADGTFDPGESFVFYGLSYWDRFPQRLGKGAVTRPHVYWLSLAPGGGARMEPSEAWVETENPTTPLSFPEAIHLHEDRVLNTAPYEAETHLFWLSSMFSDESLAIEVPSPDPSAPYGVRARFQPVHPTVHAFALYVQNGGGAVDTVIARDLFLSSSYYPEGKTPYISDSGPAGSAGFLSPGANSVRITGERLRDGEWVPGLGAYLDWVELSYSRLYEAWNDTITCTADTSSAPWQIEMAGFSSPNLLAFDVTDPVSPAVYSLDDRNITDSGDGTYLLTIRGEPPLRHRIAAAATSAVRVVRAEDIEIDRPSDLKADGAGADYLVVVYDDFASEIEPLAALRESEGFSVAVAMASDVYDEFGDGYKSPEAIKDYFIYAYNNWGSAYALIVGDANEDRENLLTGPQGDPTPPDFVPSYLMRQDGVRSAPYGPELVNSDSWYGVHLDGDTGDWLPDMFIGRLPAGSAQEARDMVEKILRYESFGPSDSWRSRGLLVADDDYSSSIFFNRSYCFQFSEEVFDQIGDRLAATLNDDELLPGFRALAFKLSDYLGAYPDDPKLDCYEPFVLRDVQDYTRANVTPVLLDSISVGCLFVNYQGHGNEDQWTHEFLFTSYGDFAAGDDVSALGNTDRPFVLFAYSCHISDFDDVREGYAGDCLGERVMILPEAGAVASYASSGYEYISTSIINDPILEAFLVDPPVDESSDEAFIRLGAAIAKGSIDFWLTAPALNRHALKTYVTLGDPGMKVDAAPPRITAALGDSALADGDTIEDPTGSGGLDLHYEIRDEVAVDSTSIFIREVWHRTEGQDSTHVAPPTDYTVYRDRQGRRYGVDYTVHLLPASMELIVGAVDRNGRSRTMTLKSVFSAVWEADGRPVSQNDLVDSSPDMTVRISSPVPVEGQLLSVILDGARNSSFSKSQIDVEGMEWELVSADLSLEDGPHTFSLLVDGRPVKTVTVRVDTRFRFASIIPFPSPCDEEGTTFFYEITSTGDVEINEVVLKIYSVAGRLVAELHDPAPAVGRGSIYWPALDDHGDRVANGVYICRAVAVGSGGRKARIQSKVAVAR